MNYYDEAPIFFTVWLLSTSIFLLLYLLIVPYLSPFISRTFSDLDKHQKKIWSENVVSTIHAILTTVLGLYILFFDELSIKNPVNGNSIAIKLLVSGVAGPFMLADIIIMMLVGDRTLAFYLHHLSLVVGGFVCVSKGTYIPWFSAAKTITEASTPLVHAIWFLKITRSLAIEPYKLINEVLKLITYIVFTFCRIVPFPFYWIMVYRFWSDGCSIGFVWYMVISAGLTLDLLNIFWWIPMTKKFGYFAYCKIFKKDYDDLKHNLTASSNTKNKLKEH